MIVHTRAAVVAVCAAAVLGAAGCAEAAQEPGPTTGAPASRDATAPPAGGTSGTTSSPEAPVEPDVRTLQVDVTGTTVSPPPALVDLAVGETLRLVVTADRDTEIHAHGFEVDSSVPAGEPTSVDLTGVAPGVYEVELHDPDLLLLQVAVR